MDKKEKIAIVEAELKTVNYSIDMYQKMIDNALYWTPKLEADKRKKQFLLEQLEELKAE